MTLRLESPTLDILRASLPEAVAWYRRAPRLPQPSRHVDEPDATLRSMRLCPPLFSEPGQTVWRVIESRRYALGITKREHPTGRVSLAGGRLLYYIPEQNLADGAACQASAGFFDIENIPPWDTWLCVAQHRILVSWVAPEDVARASAGIEVNPECCIAWAGDIETPFNKQLREEGLLP